MRPSKAGDRRATVKRTSVVLALAILALSGLSFSDDDTNGSAQPDRPVYQDYQPDIRKLAPKRITDAYPLSDQGNRGDWVAYPPMTDEFEGDSLDPKKWWDHNPDWQGRQPGFFYPGNIAVRDGKLQLTMQKQEVPEMPKERGYHTYTAAAVKSKDTVLYGYFEVAAKPMRSDGSSAFWFYNSTKDWWTEIDVYEIGGGAAGYERKMNMNLHEFHTPTSKEHWQVGGVFEAPEDLADAYHVYGVEWDEKEIKYYFDGVLVRSGPNTNWRQPLYLNFDTETMPDWFGLPKDEDLPSTYSIEYVRAWKKRAPAPDPLETLNLLAYGGVGQMKFQMGGEPGGEAPDLDDSDWPVEYVGYGCDIPNTNLWFRTKVVIPERIGGFRIAGRDLTLHLFIDDGGEVYVNGEALGSFTTSNGRFKLATDTQPGQTFVIAVRAVNDDVWGELLDAHVDFSGLEDFQKDLQRLALRLFNAKRSARESGERRAYWDAKIDAVVRTAMAGDAFARGDEEGFVKALQREMRPLEPLFTKRICFHEARFGADGNLLPWTTWEDALEREMKWYLACPIENGYPKFVCMTFMDADCGLYRNRKTFIPATQNGMGIISYVKYYRYKARSNAKVLACARAMGDYLVKECVTPDEGEYARFTRSTGRALMFPQPPDCGSQGDKPYEVEPDKGGIAGYALMVLYEETQAPKYLEQALQNARVLARHIRPGDAAKSPWPFRVDYRTGEGRGEVSSNMSYILRLFDALIESGHDEFREPRAQLWAWIVERQIPSAQGDGKLWAQFFEDYALENNRNAWAPLNLARYLLDEREAIDPDWRAHTDTLMRFVHLNFASVRDGVVICGEQDDDTNPWGGILANYGGVLSMYAAATGSERYARWARETLSYGLYTTGDNGCPSDTTRHDTPGGWQEDAHTDKLHNYMDALAAFPQWAGSPESAK